MRMHTIPTYFALLILLSASVVSQAEDVISKNVDIHAFSDLLAQHADDTNAQIIDVRTQAEFQSGHLADAQLIDFYDKGFVQKLDKLDKEKTYLMYCRTGNRSGKALKFMKKLGFKVAYNMQGGMRAWSRADYPVVTAK
ncbi:MAG: rhodanese-related sulfurtransferase [Methylophagaceae bacterium]|jgi:rhodanese-related sulfurtransferase